jgi:putative tryptophan/tyrosine transport system substrate-binding protein
VSATDGLNISAITIPVRAMSELESAFEIAGRENLDALLILSSPLFGAQANLLADLALRHKLPTVTLFPDFARAGGLMAYGPNLLETYRPLGRMIAQIFKGAAPGEIAVERPSKFELVVNVRAARAIGLTVPTAILLRADEVIE